MSTLYIRLPSKAAADSLSPGMPLYCQYAYTAGSGAIEREGVAALSELAEPVGKAQQVVLLLAASDVTLLRVKVPPLPPAKLRAALPNLVEDSLMSDPAECVVVVGDMLHDLRTVGVVQRNWLEMLSKTLRALGARRVVAVPSQLCLPLTDSVSAAVMEQGEDIEVAVRLAEQEGIGLGVMADQPESAAFDVIQSLAAVVPQAALTLYVPQARLRDYQESLHLVPALEERIKLVPDSWTHWVSGAADTSLNLMSGLGGASGPQFNWRPWRWPLALAIAVLVINALGLNIEWLRLKREAEALRANMIQTYRSAFPKDQVIVDPLAQMRQKMTAAQRESGQIAPDDFIALAAALGEVMRSVAPGASPIAALEYHDRSLTVKLKPGSSVPVEPVRNALAARNLSISQPNTGVWQIRSAR
ncbi:type II secretion system protein GspL [Noviherbaspirillum autotrophicum]|uniref:General secretion pathway protein GspL n=1 Tax=Noviherbaspirillum autotrophicum TaxID=709839 RepID=A0A0C1YQU2_9BURK|nr:type II secretion system protein GspL [Noviherbaspirillum autotrophicum]KIF82967.1 general secretion pathway protein GspL [Noviherbaspirillum autotrophicum]